MRDAQRRHEQRLAQQQRLNQQRYLRDYYARVRARDQRWGSYDPGWYSAPVAYRYQRAGNYHDINRYTANLLQQAVDLGYREGRHAGRADRDDGWRPDHRNSYAWQDASYGYNGWYADSAEYTHYFREGFERGYEDGYYERSRHGRRGDNGEYLILAAVLSAILGFQQL
ncbi:hypothetical protein WCE41_06575 [Luteimonas sp. MJ246]|uniref:hypothetical protein n=1 Tax=Luteimonas sp. MJ174 TaxID=3129237 RepID=UPI0031BA4D50